MGRFDVRAVVFDLDGVLVDSESINVRSAAEAFAAAGYRLEAEDSAQIVGRHPVDYVPVLSRRLGIPAGLQREIRGVQREIYIRLWKSEARLNDGAAEVLAALRDRGYRLALATSAGRPHADHCLERFGLAAFFDLVFTKDEVAVRKPDPEIYLRCARGFGIEPSEMLVVEDSQHGVQAAKAAGANCVAVRSEHVPGAAVRDADALIDAVPELMKLLK